MTHSDKPPSKQEKAIHDYLESLLFEEDEDNADQNQQAENTSSSSRVRAVPQTSVPETQSLPHAEMKTPTALIGLEKLVAEIPDVINEVELKVESQTETKIEQEVQLGSTLEVELEQQVEISEKEETKTPVETQSTIPDWAQERFQCLLFKVSGLSLAVPLVKLNSVIPWKEEITKTPNQTEWYLGLVQHLNHQVKIIDTAMLVMPENRHMDIESDPGERLGHILLVDDYKWGLACDCIGDVIWLTQDEVKWRKDKTSRAWLSGTSLEHLCAIMDTEVFAQMLDTTG